MWPLTLSPSFRSFAPHEARSRVLLTLMLKHCHGFLEWKLWNDSLKQLFQRKYLRRIEEKSGLVDPNATLIQLNKIPVERFWWPLSILSPIKPHSQCHHKLHQYSWKITCSFGKGYLSSCVVLNSHKVVSIHLFFKLRKKYYNDKCTNEIILAVITKNGKYLLIQSDIR